MSSTTPSAPLARSSTAADARVWQLHPLHGSLGEHASAWDDLNTRLHTSQALLDSQFVDALLKHFGDGNEALCIRSAHGRPDAMLVLHRSSAMRWASFLPAQAQLGPHLLPRDDALAGLVHALPGNVLSLDLLSLDPALSGISGTPAVRLRFEHALTMSIRLTGSFDDYLAARPSKLRQNLRRYEQRARSDGLDPVYREITAPDDMSAAVDRYGDLEATGWKGTRGTALTAGSGQRRFYREVLEQRAQRGEAVVHELWLGGQLAASRLVLRRCNVLYMLKTAYNENLRSHAPGRLLLRHVLARAFEQHPGGCVEFNTDARRDLLAWATDWRSIQNVRVFRSAGVAITLKGLRLGRIFVTRPRLAVPAGDELASYPSAADLPSAERALMESAARWHGMESGATWFHLLQQHVLGRDHEIRFFVLRREGAPVAILPMAAPHARSRHPRSLSNYYTALYAPAIEPWLRAADLVPLLHTVRRHWPRAASFDFEPLAIESREFALLREALEAAHLVPFRYFRFGNWYLPCSGVSAPDFMASRDGQLRNTISRMARKFAAQGGRLEIVRSADRYAAGLQAFQQVYARSWKTAEPFPGFISALMQACLDRGWLRLGVAWLGEQPVAVQIWIVAHGRAEIFKLAYDEQHKALSAGTLLSQHLFAQVLDSGEVSEIDYLIGDDAYKKTWMSHRRERWGLLAYNPRSFTGMALLLRELLTRSLRRLAPRRTMERPNARDVPGSCAHAPVTSGSRPVAAR